MRDPTPAARRPVAPSERHVVVVGAGISGLVAAYELARSPDGPRVTVLEQAARIGGKLEVSEVDGIPVDQGAESVLARRPEAVDLIRAVGLEGDLVHPATTRAAVWSRGALRPLPEGTVMGVPTDLRALATSQVLPVRGLARLPLDHLRPWTRHVRSRDVPVGWYVRHRLGHEVVDRLVEPLLGGVYAGRADELSLAATIPALAGPVRSRRSLLAAAADVRSDAPPDDRPVFASLRGGLGRLPRAVAEAATSHGATIRTACAVRELTRTADGWRLVVGPTADPELVHADAVVLACPATATRRLLEQPAPAAARALRGLAYASVGVVTLVLPDRDGADELSGSGFLVPAVERRTIKAATFLTNKWAWLDRVAGDRVVVRASVGRHGEVAALQRDPEHLVDAVAADLAELAGTPRRPLAWAVRKWGGGLPQYTVGHRERVEDVRRAVRAAGRLAVCGAAYDGVGVAACVADARAAATEVLAGLADDARAGRPARTMGR